MRAGAEDPSLGATMISMCQMSNLRKMMRRDIRRSTHDTSTHTVAKKRQTQSCHDDSIRLYKRILGLRDHLSPLRAFNNERFRHVIEAN
jgi:hypothetical protein